MTDKSQPTILTRGVDLTLTPEEVFENLHRLPGFFFLDSGLADHPLANYSYVGVHPFQTLRSRGDGMDMVEGKKIRHLRGDPLTVLSTLLKNRELKSGSPMVPFAGGAVGYFGYELGAVTTERESTREDDLGLPEMHIAFYNTILAYEHRTKRWYGAAVDLTGGRGTTIRKRLGKEIDKLVDLVQQPPKAAAPPAPAETEDAPDTDTPGRRFEVDGLPVSSTLSRDEYLGAVRKIQDHIAAGDIYQANLTQRWSIPYPGDPGRLYRALRETSPAPFGMYMNTGECVIAGSSPESFLSIHGRAIETRPIKGTRPRGTTPDDDARLSAELTASEKDRAELTMIADLERNDLGKICTTGSVTVGELHRLESFSNVHHLVSVVKGELKGGTSFEDIMRATFPGGSITGAPKLRAMEILDAVEGRVRGPYTGAMGYLGLDGSAELNIAIRTLVVTQGTCHLGVGSGIVADSSPEAEYEECLAKARDMVTALRMATEEPAEAVAVAAVAATAGAAAPDDGAAPPEATVTGATTPPAEPEPVPEEPPAAEAEPTAEPEADTTTPADPEPPAPEAAPSSEPVDGGPARPEPEPVEPAYPWSPASPGTARETAEPTTPDEPAPGHEPSPPTDDAAGPSDTDEPRTDGPTPASSS